MSDTDFQNASFDGKRVCIVGFGMEGVSACKFLLEKGAEVSVADERGREAFEDEVVREFEEKGVTFEFGKIPSLAAFDVVVRSPGISVMRQEIVEANGAGVLVTSASKIFFDLSPAKIIGVSGSKGKGTTSTLIFEMLKRAGRDVHLAGNIGAPMLDLLPILTSESYVVLELSSFQLADLHRSPNIAVLLMVVPEHLDYHDDFTEYIEAKRNLVRFQTVDDYAILNHDSPPSNESDVLCAGHVLSVSREHKVMEGCFVKEGALYIDLNGLEERIVSVEEIKLVGGHNLENACAATLVAKIVGVSNEDIAKILREFGGLPHRLELVREVDGVTFYNDSFSTIPETTIAAIEAFEQPKVLILGGSSKESDFEELGNVISEGNVRGIVGIGEEWGNIKSKIRNSNIKIVEGKNKMKDVVEAAKDMAVDGDVVVLSPACASFDMFESYKERGDLFRQEVMKLR